MMKESDTLTLHVSHTHFLQLILICVVLVPWMPIAPGAPKLRPEWFILLAGLMVHPIPVRVFRSPVTFWAGLTVVAYLLSFFFGAAFLGISVGIKDIFSLLAPILFYIFYIFAASKTYSTTKLRRLLKTTTAALTICAVLGILQYFIYDLTSPLLQIWNTEERLVFAQANGRATATMTNANDFGFLMVIGFALKLFTFRYKLYSKYIALMMLFTLFSGVFVSGSRTSLICLSVVIGMFILTGKFSTKKFFGTLAVLFGICFLLINLQSAEAFSLIISRTTSIQDFQEQAAFVARVQGAISTIPMIQESWFFGHGPAKSTFTIGSNIDNEYILILYRHGIFGLVSTIGFVWAISSQKWNDLKGDQQLIRQLKPIIIATLIASALFALTAGIFMSFRLFALLILVWSILARLNTSENLYTGQYVARVKYLADEQRMMSS